MNKLRITTANAEQDVSVIHAFLSSHSSWAKGISQALVSKSIEHSLCFGGFLGDAQVAFARVISDYSTFANLVDVFVLPGHRGNGHGKALMDAVMAHPQLQGLRRFTLATGDAHELYARYGFTTPRFPASLMERYAPDVYSAAVRPRVIPLSEIHP